ncbi:MAG: RluA family pseudouridine synthase [Gemmataceae bacterium]|nr:RluA family pseudouridine synthase [Gemmataceae bacterium]
MAHRRITLSAQHDGQPLGKVLAAELHLDRRRVQQFLRSAAVRLNGLVCRQAGQRVRAGECLEIIDTGPSPGGASSQASTAQPSFDTMIRIVDCDDHIVIVDKPAGLTTVRHAAETRAFGARAQRYLPPTLVDLLPRTLPELRRGRLRAVHRLDKETSGLLVVARTAEAERELGRQFRAHAVTRTYLALVRGQAKDERIESWLAADRGDGRRGSSSHGRGQRAVTYVRVVERLGPFTLVECRLETGRTHQVRIHLGERGTPLCGERVYDRPLHGPPVPDPSGAQRPMLHAATLGLIHPATKQRLTWTSTMPADMAALLQRLRSAPSI